MLRHGSTPSPASLQHAPSEELSEHDPPHDTADHPHPRLHRTRHPGQAGLRRPDARHVRRLPLADDRRPRDAAHRRRARRGGALQLDRDRHDAGLRRVRARDREALRPLREALVLPGGPRRVHGRIDPGGPVAGLLVPGLRPRRAGPGHGRADAAVADDHRRHHPAASARQVPGDHGRRLRRDLDRRPADRGLRHRPPGLALAVLPDAADRGGGLRLHPALPAPGEVRAARHRRLRRHPHPHPRPGPGPARHHLGRQ